MFGRETRMLLRHYLEQGTSKSALARKLGVHRDTIHRWIRDGELDRDLDGEPVRYGPRRPVATKLDAYKAIVEARLAAYPQLSAVRLLDEIRAAGYAGGYTQLKAFVQRVRPTPAPEPVIRFETPAGRQAQVDFAVEAQKAGKTPREDARLSFGEKLHRSRHLIPCVLLIVFMISAPMMNQGIQVDLPRTQAQTLDDAKDPIELVLKPNGQILTARTLEVAPNLRHLYLYADEMTRTGRVTDALKILPTMRVSGIHLAPFFDNTLENLYAVDSVRVVSDAVLDPSLV